MTRVAVVLFGAATLLSHSPRDAPPQQPATGTIRGRVVAEASGDPIRNARVSVTDDYERPPVLSDVDGRFAFLALPAGSFTVTAGKAGFAKTTFGARSPGAAGTPIRVADGAVVDEVVLALPRGAAIEGTVVDDTGEPVPGASVMIERVVARSRATPVPIVGLTDESGRYRIGSLGAGPVLVSVFSAARSIVMLPGGGVMSGGGDVGQRIYYPGGVKAERGEPVSLQVGHEELGVDFVTPASVPVGPRVAPAPRDATVVSGRIVSVEGRPLPGAQVMLEPNGSTEAPRRQTVSDADGAYQFVLPRGASGTFRVRATRLGYLPGWYGQRDQRDVPEEIPVVAGEVTANLNVALAIPAVIAGRIFDENGDPVEGARVRTSINPCDSRSWRRRMQSDDWRIAMKKSNSALRLQPSLMEEAKKVAKAEGVAIPWQIVGVVRDEKVNGIADDRSTGVYVSNEQSPVYFQTLSVRTSADPLPLQKSIAAAIHGVNKDQALTDIRTMDQIKERSMANNRLQAALLGVFATVALLLAGIGMYGVISYSVAQRTQEIGIRAALGATEARLLQLVLNRGVVLTVLGLVIGILGSLGLTRLMASLLYGVGARDPATMLLVGALLALVAVMACYLPARRATKIDPMLAVRCE